MDSVVLLMFAAIFIVGILIFVAITMGNRRHSGLDRAYFERQWQRILSFKSSGETGWQLAIFEADKLLDHAMQQCNFGGATMGDRLKSAGGAFRNTNDVWSAHKLRNRLAHEQNVPLNGIVVDKALRAFKAALKDLGAL